MSAFGSVCEITVVPSKDHAEDATFPFRNTSNDLT